jgi:hypothetical protein
MLIDICLELSPCASAAIIMCYMLLAQQPCMQALHSVYYNPVGLRLHHLLRRFTAQCAATWCTLHAG